MRRHILSLYVATFVFLFVQSAFADVKICSFNIQFLGASKLRDNQALAKIVKDAGCDVVVVQELISPPDLKKIPGSPLFGKPDASQSFPDGTVQKPVELVTNFFLAMFEAGFTSYRLSPEKSGPGAKVNINGTASEYWVYFYKPGKIADSTSDSGWISSPLAKNPGLDRVPYAFNIKCPKNKTDMVFIPVHLHPGPGSKDRARRLVELKAIYEWIGQNKTRTGEQNYVILGDFNLEDDAELKSVTAGTQMASLNSLSVKTNTNVNGPKPYDHVFIEPSLTPEIATEKNFEVLDLVEKTKKLWKPENGTFPGLPYIHNLFRFYYSDHSPVKFKLKCRRDND